MKKLCLVLSACVCAFALFACNRGGGGNGEDHASSNSPPEITSSPLTVAVAGEVYTYDADAADVDGDTLTYGLANFPEGMSVGPASGVVTWTPGSSTVGNHWIAVTATDGETSASQYFTIRVNPDDNGVPFQRGAVLTSWWNNDYSQERTEKTVLRMKENGCEYLSVLFTWYQDTLDSTTIVPSPEKSPSDAGVIHVTVYAHSLGLKVFYKPHIDVMTGEWNGFIEFSNEDDWNAWFASYDQFIDHYLDLAVANSVEGFVIGTELKKTECRESNWRNTIALARSKYSGYLTYSANHDSYHDVSWWDDLDFIGVSGYFRLTNGPEPTLQDLIAAWDDPKNKLKGLKKVADYWGKDIVFTEVGYQSRNGTNITPWWTDGSPDEQEQALCYESLFKSLYHEPWFKGVHWWMYYWDPEQDVNGFDIYNKPAEDILIYWYAGR